MSGNDSGRPEWAPAGSANDAAGQIRIAEINTPPTPTAVLFFIVNALGSATLSQRRGSTVSLAKASARFGRTSFGLTSYEGS
jgi:hypothetical protein